MCYALIQNDLSTGVEVLRLCALLCGTGLLCFNYDTAEIS